VAFPTRWIQTWTWIPRIPLWVAGVDPPGTTRYWNNMRWWTVDGPGDLTDATFRTACLNFISFSLINAYAISGLSIENLCWLAGHSQQGSSYNYGIISFYDTAIMPPVLPDQVSACVKLYSSVGGRRGQGRTFYSNVPVFLSEGNYLNDLGVEVYRELAYYSTQVVNVGTTTLTPCLPSYADATLLPIERVVCNRHLSMILRRSRSPAQSFPPNYKPPFPPPP
jgi:hypothetical protein